jgi:hypothetical protein
LFRKKKSLFPNWFEKRSFLLMAGYFYHAIFRFFAKTLPAVGRGIAP